MKGFTLIDVLVGTALMLIVFLGIFGAYQLGLKVLGQSKARITAIVIGNQKIEEIRNLPYSKAGTNEPGCFPCGDIAKTATATQNNIIYTITTRIDYIDDPKDGLASQDSTYTYEDYKCCPTDYKKVKVTVSWSGKFSEEVYFDGIISPRSGVQECGETGGVLKVSVFNAKGEMVSSPLIEVDNIITGLHKDASPDDGIQYFVLPTSTDAYKIKVSETSYSTSQTYRSGDIYQGQTIITPEKPNATILEGQLTETSFSIDKLSKFSIKASEAKAKHIYYIRKNGKDNNDGLSPNSAFLTIQKAASVMTAGDIVFVGAGIYEEKIVPQNSGTSGQKIAYVSDIFGNYTGDAGEIKISGKDFGFYIQDKTYLEIYGFKISNTTSSAIYIGGSVSKNIKIVNNIISNNSGDGIYLQSASDITISHNNIYFNVRGIYLNNANSNYLIKNTVYQNSLEGIKIEKSNAVNLTFNTSFSNGGSGILIANNSNNCEIKNNTIYSNSQDGILTFDHCSSVVALNNKSYSNQGSGIVFKTHISNASKITSNLIYSNQKAGVLLSDNCVNNTVSNNTVFQNQEEGILIEISSNNEIKDNIVVKNILTGIKVFESPNIDETYNNVWQNNPNYSGILAATTSLSSDPLFVDSGNNDFHLSQIAAGQSQDSPCKDAGSDDADEIELNSLTLADMTTRTDNITDSGIVDMGFHYSLETIPPLPSASDPFGVAITNTQFHLRGDKIVGKNALEQEIYKYSQATTTDVAGSLEIKNLEWDSYTFSDFKSGGINLDLIVSYPSPAIEGKTEVFLSPDIEQIVKLGLRAENTLLVKVQDAFSSEPLFSSRVRVYKIGSEATKLTDMDGYVYFIPLEKAIYNLEVSAEGYASSTESVFVDGHAEKIIELTEI